MRPEYEHTYGLINNALQRKPVIEFERLNMRAWPGRFESRNVPNRWMDAQVQEHLVAGEEARAAIVELNFDHLGRDETSASYDQLGAARLVVAKMQFDLAVTGECLKRPGESDEIAVPPREPGCDEPYY
jgi:hypothetical protein